MFADHPKRKTKSICHIQISKLIENNTTGGLAQFFANPGSLKLYIGSQPNKENMFTGNIYNVGINTYKHTSFTLDSYFYNDGTFKSYKP